MKYYYEFSKNEHYALVVVTVEGVEPDVKPPYEQATEKYVEIVAGNSVEQVLAEGRPKLITEELAFWYVCHANKIRNKKLSEVLEEFNGLENEVLLIF